MRWFRLAEEVAQALHERRAVVALESTILAHGLPFPRSLEVAHGLEAAVRAHGAVPATIAVIDGLPLVGLSPTELERVASSGKALLKASTRDLPHVCAKRLSAATTVASTMHLAALAGVQIFATGGIGGVHRGDFDVSADLLELSRTPVTVVCAGVKSILDIRRTLEALESLSVPVVVMRSNNFPAFYSPRSHCPSPAVAQSVQEVAELLQMRKALNLSSGLLLAVPPPVTVEGVDAAVVAALDEAAAKGIQGPAITPFLLKAVQQLTGGEAVEANVALVRNNVEVAAQLAQTLAQPITSPSLFQSATGGRKSRADAVAVVGAAVVDWVAMAAGAGRRRSSSPGEVRRSLGGVACNIASELRRQSPQIDVSLISSVGDDTAGREVARECRARGLDVAALRIVPGRVSPCYVAIHDQTDGELVAAVADMQTLREDLIPQTFSRPEVEQRLREASVVVADANLSAPSLQALASRCCALHRPLVFEPTSIAKCPLPLEAGCLSAVTVATPNGLELVEMVRAALSRGLVSPEDQPVVAELLRSFNQSPADSDSFSRLSLDQLRALGFALLRVMIHDCPAPQPASLFEGRHLLVTMGARGVLWCGWPSRLLRPRDEGEAVVSGSDDLAARFFAVEPLQPLHTNGAGDAFLAGFLASAVAREKRSDLPDELCVLEGLQRARDLLLSTDQKAPDRYT